jgi:membrane-associated phospholipid phosphatase
MVRQYRIMSRSRLSNLDRYLYLLSQQKLRTRWATVLMVRITQSGTKGSIWVGICVLLFLFGDVHARAAALTSLCSLLLAEGVINAVLKPAIARERPYSGRGPGRLRLLLVKAPGAHSWPSGHAGSAMAAAVPLAVAYPAAGILFLALAALIGFSRVYVGVHYPFDVLAGAITGALCAVVVLALSLLLSRVGWWPGAVLGLALLR